jgi:hypothetical protein
VVTPSSLRVLAIDRLRDRWLDVSATERPEMVLAGGAGAEMTMRRSIYAGAIVSVVMLVTTVAFADWDPQRFADEDVIELMTVSAEKGEHWFPVWLVVIQGDVYVRLGSRAAGRVESNTRAPLLSVRIAGEEFASVGGEPVPAMAERVADAMAEKYWSDIFVRFFAHPLTLRLKPTVEEAHVGVPAG